MNLQSLRQEFEQVLDFISSTCDTYAIPEIISGCQKIRQEIDAPLKIALVGETSAGKSTLLNAMVGCKFAPTAPIANTYNVNILKHSSRSPVNREALFVHYEDGRIEEKTLDYFERIVDGRDKSSSKERENILMVEGYRNFDYLKDIDLIDSPGLFSNIGVDSDKTIQMFLDPIRQPDVFIYMAQRAIKADTDLASVKSFQSALSSGKSRVNGLNTVLALTHCDYLCRGDYSKDFHAIGMGILNDNRKYASFRECFSKTFTLAAIFAQTAYSIKEDDFAIIKLLESEIGDDILYLYTKDDFLNDQDVFGQFITSKDERTQFLDRIEMDVIKFSIWLIRQNKDLSYSEYRELLLEYSGVNQMNEYVFNTFKRLSIFFKTSKIIAGIRKTLKETIQKYMEPEKLEASHRMIVVCKDFENALNSSFSFLSVLMDYFSQSVSDGVESESYFSENDWACALQVIDECLKGNPNKELLRKHQKQLEAQRELYIMISNIQAKESCDKLLNQINIVL